MSLDNFTENNIICGNVDFQLQATQEAVSYSQYLVSFETLKWLLPIEKPKEQKEEEREKEEEEGERDREENVWSI